MLVPGNGFPVLGDTVIVLFSMERGQAFVPGDSQQGKLIIEIAGEGILQVLGADNSFFVSFTHWQEAVFQKGSICLVEGYLVAQFIQVCTVSGK